MILNRRHKSLITRLFPQKFIRRRSLFIQFGLVLISIFFQNSAQATSVEALRSLPVQDAGRLKPYDTFARESLALIHGKMNFKGKDPVEVVTTWLVIPESWDKIELLEVRHSGLRDALKLDHQRIYYSVQEIMSNERMPLIFQELKSIREQGEKLNPYFQAVQRLDNQLTLYQAIRAGAALRIVPSVANDNWQGANELQDPLKGKFSEVLSKFVNALDAGGTKSNEELKEAGLQLQKAVEDFKESARAIAPEKYASEKLIALEVHYNQFHPVKWAWIAYLLGVLAWAVCLVNGHRSWSRLGWAAVTVGFLLHAYSMGLRIFLAGRPPVSNMYETVVWVPWGTLLFSFLLYRFQKQILLVMAAAIVSIGCLILTDLAPVVLDSSIHPLEPVLRSTFWLSTHVLIISISYAAFFLAFAIGDWLLVLFLKDEVAYAAQIASGVNSIYRAIQIGVVLLAAGIILGGVWAAYSWGRFWGWDPKETWALIALLGYVALLHGRLAGWAKQFGMAAGAVVAFSLVIMAWYGVNFVLGAGLHSYGFGAGGVEYVSAFVAAHLLFVVFVGTVRKSRSLS